MEWIFIFIIIYLLIYSICKIFTISIPKLERWYIERRNLNIEQTFIQTDCDTCLSNKEQWTIRDMEKYTYKPQFTEHRLYTCSVCQKYICITFTGTDIIREFIPKKEFMNCWNDFVQNKEHLEYIPKVK